MKAVKTRILEAILREVGAEPGRIRRSHQRWVLRACHTTVVRHSEQGAGVLRSIEKDLAPCIGSPTWLRDRLGQ